MIYYFKADGTCILKSSAKELLPEIQEKMTALTSKSIGAAQVGEATLDYDLSQIYGVNNEVKEFTPEEMQIKSNLPDGFIWQMPQRIAVDTRALSVAKEQAWTRIKAARDQAQLLPFNVDGVLYDTSSNVSDAAQMAMAAQISNTPFSIQWTTFNNSVVILDGPGMINVGMKMGMFISSIFDKARAYRVQIDACTTIQDADSIQWSTT